MTATWRSGAPLAWRALLAATAVVPVAWMLAVPAVPPRIEPVSVRAPSAVPAPTAARIAESYPHLARTPLFWPDRAPWQPPAPPAAMETVTAALDGYLAVGVMISGDVRQALIRPPHTARAQMLTEGDVLEGWTLRHIERDRLVFVTGTTRFEMPIGKRLDTRP